MDSIPEHIYQITQSRSSHREIDGGNQTVCDINREEKIGVEFFLPPSNHPTAFSGGIEIAYSYFSWIGSPSSQARQLYERLPITNAQLSGLTYYLDLNRSLLFYHSYKFTTLLQKRIFIFRVMTKFLLTYLVTRIRIQY